MPAKLELFQNASEVPLERRGRIVEDINRIIAMDWNVRRAHWTDQNTPFHSDHGVLLLSNEKDFIGELIYKRLSFGGRRVIYISGTDVHTAYRDSGFLKLMLDTTLGAEFGTEPASSAFYLCFRTRSPLVHHVGRTLCDPLVPAIGEPTDVSLMAVAAQVARTIFPHRQLELESLVMRGVYLHMSYKREPKCRLASETEKWFAAKVPDPADSVFCLGLCRNRWSGLQSQTSPSGR